jgi:hypothetical protein
MLRYIYDGRIQESSVGCIGSAGRSDSLFNHEQKAVSKFSLGFKLVAQTYDGALVIVDT